jgi:pseudaminic acid biosynthesis-associated methylase
MTREIGKRTMNDTQTSEASRLEQLWAGNFGDAYLERNRGAGDVRAAFWQMLLTRFQAERVLEIGCNVGANLRWIAGQLSPANVYGIDINANAIRELQAAVPGINALSGPARSLPFRDRWFDLVFTMGVLIHQPESTLPLVINEMVRCSRKYVLCGEYYAAQTTELAYREEHGALFKRDYPRIFRELYPELRLVEQGFLGREQGWDNITWWLFEIR